MILEASGTLTATITTEHTVNSNTGVKTFVFMVDRAAMVAGDRMELRIKTKCLAGGTLRTCYIQTFDGAPSADDMIAVSVPLPSDIQADFTLKQTTGTGRAFPWKVLSL